MPIVLRHPFLNARAQSSPRPPPSLPNGPSTRFLSPTHTFSDPSSSSCPTHLKDALDRAEAYLLPVYARPPIVMSHGKGCWVWDTEGRKYLDFSAGIAVNALGHSDDGMVQVSAQRASVELVF